MTQLLREAESDRAGVDLVLRVEAIAYQINSLEWETRAEPERAGEIAVRVATARQAIEHLMADLEHRDAPGGTYQLISANVAAYDAAIAGLYLLWGSGDFAAAVVWDEKQVDPRYDDLLAAINIAAPRYATEARHDGQRALAGSATLLLLAASGVGAISWRFERTRRRALLVETERRAIHESDIRFRALVQHGADLITALAPDGTIRYQSPSSATLLGYEPETLSGRHFAELVHPDDIATAHWLIEQTGRREGGVVAAELRFRHADGSWPTLEAVASLFPADAGMDGVLLTSRDVSERKALEVQLRHQALHDPLTGLPNRTLFRDRLEHALARATRSAAPLAVLFLDLDEFKVVNDSLGHKSGDELLVVVAERLRAGCRPGDTVARLGGDEFTVLLEAADLGAAVETAERISDRLRTPIELNGHAVVVSVSIGIAGKGSPDDRADNLLRNADVAMYVAKQKGRGRYAVFNASMHAKAWERLELEAELRQAIAAGEFHVYYQPVVQLDTGLIVGVEALVRWEHPERGVALPAEFIPLAEETGLIIPIGWWVLAEACRQVQDWQSEFFQEPPLTVSVNLSPSQFLSPALVESVARVLAETGLDPVCLTLELTEGVMMQDGDAIAATLRRLKALGVRLAIDDFGTGYSSLAYLHRFPIDALKIDRSFVSRLGHGTEGQAIVRTIGGLAKTLGLTVTGEGIETAEQLAELKALGIARGQGYLFARPLPAAELHGLLRDCVQWSPAGDAGEPATPSRNGFRAAQSGTILAAVPG